MWTSILFAAACGHTAALTCDHPVFAPKGQQPLPILSVTVERLEKERPQPSYSGTVKEITANSILLDIPEQRYVALKQDADGRTYSVDMFIIPPRPQRLFGAGKALGEGKSGGKYDNDSYRLSDLKVGDQIEIVCSAPGVADTVCILRRPGGKVRPSPLSKPNDPDAWHVHMNAQQAEEEGRIAPPPRPVSRSGPPTNQ
jgi:hypothetical protein